MVATLRCGSYRTLEIDLIFGFIPRELGRGMRALVAVGARPSGGVLSSFERAGATSLRRKQCVSWERCFRGLASDRVGSGPQAHAE